MNFDGKVALVTGGSSGIGLALAQELAGRGARVFILARRVEALQAALERVAAADKERQPRNAKVLSEAPNVEAGEGIAARAMQDIAPLMLAVGGQHGAISADVTNPQQVQQAVQKVSEQVGGIDLLVNCAGVAQPGYVQEMPLELFRWQMDVNYFGVVHCTQAVLPGMMARKAGTIVNVSSFVGKINVFGYAAYGPSKAAVVAFSQALRMEVKDYGIRVAVVYPTDVDTPQLAYENRFKPPELKHLLPELGVLSPEKAAQAILRGIEKERFEILTDPGAGLLFFLIRLLGSRGTNAVLDWLLKRAKGALH